MSEPSSNETHVFLSVHGFDCSIEEVSKVIGALPTQAWLRGELRSVPNQSQQIQRKFNHWELSSGMETKVNFEEQIVALLERLEPISAGVKEAYLRFEVEIRVAFYTREANPGLRLSKKVVQRVGALGLAVDFDIYCLPEKSL